MIVILEKLPTDFIQVCRSRILEILAKKGFFPSSHQILLAWDPSFTWTKRIRVFNTTPHLRIPLLLVSLVNLFRSGRRAPGEGARCLDRTARMGGDGNSFYFNALILDLRDMARGDEAPASEEVSLEKDILNEFESDFLTYPQSLGPVKAWAYFPSRHHRFQSRKYFLKLLFMLGADAADLDSSSVVMCRLLRSGSSAVPPMDALELLEDHVFGAGKYGQHALAIDNGVREGDGGVLLWVHEKHNELDAGVNVNILCLLAALVERVESDLKDRVFILAGNIFRFLDRHRVAEDFSRPDFLMYYSLEVTLFLWYRFLAYLEALPLPERGRFDPEGGCIALNRHFIGLMERKWRASPSSFNAFDKLMVLPLLLREASPVATAMLAESGPLELLNAVSDQACEFGKFIYPVTLLYGNQAVGIYAAEILAREIRRAGSWGEGSPDVGPETPGNSSS